MLKKISVVCSSVILCSCSLLPGMEGPNTMGMKQYAVKQNIAVHPVLIPITPDLIADQRISTHIYRVAPADVLTISVWKHPEFSLTELQLAASNVSAVSTQGAAGQMGYLVNSNGYIYFPLIGDVYVNDKTVDEIRAQITSKLEKYVKNPQVYVRVADFRSRKIYVFGEVKNPNFIPINDQPLSIVDALTLSGNFTADAADPGHIYIIRGDMTHPIVYWLNAKTPEKLLLAERFMLKPGDVVFVSSAPAAQLNRIINQILPPLQTVVYTKSFFHS